MDQVTLFYDVVEDFASEFLSNRFDYLYESEIQARLYGLLRSRIDTRIRYQTSDDFRDKFVNVESLLTTPVRLEYPYRIRFDIALLDENSMSIDEFIWSQDVTLAAEIKFLAGPYKHQDSKKVVVGFQKDIAKLRKRYHAAQTPRITKLGVALLFMQAEPPDWRALLGKKIVEGIVRVTAGIAGVVVVADDKMGRIYSVLD